MSQGKSALLIARGWARVRVLVEMVVGIDEPRQHDMSRGVEDGLDSLGLRAPADPRHDPRPFDDDPPLRPFGENRQRVLDPCPHAGAPIERILNGEAAGIVSSWAIRRLRRSMGRVLTARGDEPLRVRRVAMPFPAPRNRMPRLNLVDILFEKIRTRVTMLR